MPLILTSIVTLYLSALFLCATAIAQEQAQEQTKAAPTAKEGEESRQKEAEDVKRLTELYLRNQSVFLRRNELMVELDTFYSRNSHSTILRAGNALIPVNTIRRFITNTFIARYGVLTDGLELDLIAPIFVHAESVVDVGGTRIQTAPPENRLGDIAGAIRYQAWYERGSRPSVIFDMEVKSPTGGSGLTGTGTWNVGGGVTLVKTIDPVVLFGRVGYTHTVASERRNLGDIFDYRLGMGFSLNERVSFTTQLAGHYIGPSTFIGALTTGIGGTAGGTTGPAVLSGRHVEVMTLLFTTTVLVTKKLFIEPVVGVALTETSFTTIGVRIPYRF